MILDEIAEKTRERIAEAKLAFPLSELKRRVQEPEGCGTPGGPYVMTENASAVTSRADTKNPGRFPFRDALKQDGVSFICEVKKGSPSKGIIAEDFPYVEIAKDYEKAGAAAISVLTEPYYFKGKNEYLTEISKNVKIPILRKDFTVDEYMIYEAKLIGASAVLLICAILDDSELKSYLELAHSLGLSALVEAHDEQEVERALKSGAGIIGVNNRDLRTFEVDITNSIRLRSMIPEDVIYVSESGIRTRADVLDLERNGTDAVLIGETFMRSPDKKATLDYLRGLV